MNRASRRQVLIAAGALAAAPLRAFIQQPATRTAIGFAVPAAIRVRADREIA